MEGTQRLEIQHDARYGEFKKKYNNAFTLSRASFQPTALLKVVLQWTMKVDRNYIGSTGLWAHKSDIFLEDGRMGTDGFTWAFGVNFLSNHSWTSGISGLTFTYVEKWVPKCTIYVPDVDPTVENTYRIEWTTTEWRAYVNDVYYGSCPVSQTEPAIVQTWADNSWVPHILLALLRLNPQGPQGTVYGPVQVWYEPTD
jgi:hypothetical protein